MRAAVMHSAEKALLPYIRVFTFFILNNRIRHGIERVFAFRVESATLLRALLITPGRLHYGGARSGSEQVAAGPSDIQTKGTQGASSFDHRVIWGGDAMHLAPLQSKQTRAEEQRMRFKEKTATL